MLVGAAQGRVADESVHSATNEFGPAAYSLGMERIRIGIFAT